MKTYNHLFHTMRQFNHYLAGIELNLDEPVLVRIHSCIHSCKAMEKLAGQIKRILPNASITGCSTTGVICEGRIISDACLISISVFEQCRMESMMLECVNQKGKLKSARRLCDELSDMLIRGREGFLLIFTPFVCYKGLSLVECMNKNNLKVHMLGGGACFEDEQHREDKNGAYVIAGDKTSTTGISAVFITAERFYVYENYVCGVESVGKTYTLTKMQRHYLDEVEGMDGAEWYADLLGREELEKNPMLSNVFPIVRQKEPLLPYFVNYERDCRVRKNGKNKRKNRLNMHCEMPKGAQISLGYFSAPKISDEMHKLYGELKTAPVESLFAYDCQARKHMLHNCANWEVGQFYTTNISGALLSSEIIYRNDRNLFANYTFAIAGLSERSKAHILLRSRDLRNVAALQQDNVQMINYLLARGNRQLNEQLELQQNSMKKAMFYNEALGLGNQLSYLYEAETKKLDKIALCALSNERMVKLFVGRKQLYSELKDIYCRVNEQLRKSVQENGKGNIYIYSYESTAMILAADTYMSEDKFYKTVKRVTDYLDGIEIGEVQLSYQCAVVIGEREALHKAEAALQYGTLHKMSYVEYSQITSDVIDTREEAHMLKVLREALDEKRVTPYFQGIYDNKNKCFGLYEALMRIEDEKGNIYYPDQFLKIAKDYNLYETLSVVMVKQVMEKFVNRDTRVSINLNVRDVYDRDMLKTIFYYLKKADHPENFVFELVESEEVTDYQYMKAFVTRVHKAGAKIAIDDFGSGFSNLIHILQIDTDYLKIDGEIIRMVCHDDKCRDFLVIMNEWCCHQNKEVIAEYVENEDIQRIIEQMGIAYSQGYYFAKPELWKD